MEPYANYSESHETSINSAFLLDQSCLRLWHGFNQTTRKHRYVKSYIEIYKRLRICKKSLAVRVFSSPELCSGWAFVITWMSVVRRASCVVVRQQFQQSSSLKPQARFELHLTGIVLRWPSCKFLKFMMISQKTWPPGGGVNSLICLYRKL